MGMVMDFLVIHICVIWGILQIGGNRAENSSIENNIRGKKVDLGLRSVHGKFRTENFRASK